MSPTPRPHTPRVATTKSSTMGTTHSAEKRREQAMNTIRTQAKVARRALTRALAFVAALFIAFGGTLVPQNPFTPPAPQTEAQTTAGISQSDFGDCNFRNGTGPVANLATNLCWIDWTGLALKAGAGQTITKKIGRYTMTFNMRILNTDVNTRDALLTGTSKPSFQPEKAVFGSVRDFDYFSPKQGDAAAALIDFANPGRFNERDMMFNMENIVIKDEKGNVVPNYSIMMADGASTFGGSTGELLSMENREGTVNPVATLTPDGFVPACSNQNGDTGAIYGTGTELAGEWGLGSGGRTRDFICYPRGTTTTGTLSPGTFVVSASNPKNLEFGMYTSSTGFQSMALAVSVGRLSGYVNPVDTSMEQAATGQATAFDFKAYDRVGSTDTEVPVTKGNFTTQLRTLGAGNTFADSYVFKSTASGAQADLALKRYDPVWTCVLNGTTTHTIKAGQTPPAGFTLTNSGTTSELAYTNPQNLPTECSVKWVPKFANAVLNLSKTVTGTAVGFDDVALRDFRLRYTCQDYNGFGAAYPSVALTGYRDLKAGGSATIGGFPQGMNCVLNEEFPDGKPAAGPGETHTLTWDSGTTSTDSPPKTTLAPLKGSNNVNAANTYDYRGGTLNLSKELVGAPVGEFSDNRVYQFEVTCTGTSYQGQQTELTITRQGTVMNGQVAIPDIPVGRDCSVKPLTGLSAEESAKYKFDGRDVTYNGNAIQADPNGAYHFTLPDYPAGGTPTSGDMRIVAKYSYQVRTVSILKELSGPAQFHPDLKTATFTMAYRCVSGGSTPVTVEGTATITMGSNSNLANIPNVPVGSQCTIYENPPADQTNVELDKIELSHSDTNDTITKLTNDEAKARPILTVNMSTDATQNRVVVNNYYKPRLGTVNLEKLVNTNGLGISLPNTFDFTFTCGTRPVVAADGTIRSIALDGTLTIAEGEIRSLALNSANADDNAAVNDLGGNLGVPYGNTCRFAEAPLDPNSYVGATWETNASDAMVKVSGESTTATVTNTFKPLGDGLTISQQYVDYPQYAEPVEYQLTCTSPSGEPLALPGDGVFTLDKTTGTKSFDAAAVPEGSQCSLRETKPDDGKRARTIATGEFPIDRDTTASYRQDSTSAATSTEFAHLAPVSLTNFTIGQSSSINIGHDYSPVLRPITASKDVVFDAATQQYISDQRKQVKQERLFTISLTCNYPLGLVQVTAEAQISSLTGEVKLADVAVGSVCEISEGSTTTAEGISVKQEVSVNGAARTPVSQTFDVQDISPNHATFTNTYSRRLADVQLNKIAQLPGSIQEQYKQAGKEIPFYTHNFTMVCKDPQTGDTAQLGTYTSTITGPGSTVFQGVPVGSDCQITGDKFGTLDLNLVDASGKELHAHLKPRQVNWTVDNNDGSASTDTDLADGETTSQVFGVIDDTTADTNYNNQVDLTNYYEYVQSTLNLTKDIVGAPEDLKLLPATMNFDFNLQCRAVGYTASTIGMGDAKLDPNLDRGDFTLTTLPDGKVVLRYTSPTVTVPAGSLCDFDERDVTDVPQELTWRPDAQQIEKRVGETADAPTTNFGFVNNFTRRTTPVAFPILHGGYLQGLDPAGYNVAVTCTDPAGTKQTFTKPSSGALEGASVAVSEPPAGGTVLNLPVGSECEVSLVGSPALAPRPELEVTAGDRAPFTQFNAWINGDPVPGGPTRPLSEYTAAEVTSALKKYTYKFDIPGDLSSTETQMVVGTASYNLRDRLDVEFTKTVVGDSGSDATFTFVNHCSPNSEQFTLKAGHSYTLTDVLAGSPCSIDETFDGSDSVNSQISVGSTGSRIANATATNPDPTVSGNLDTDTNEPIGRNIAFTPLTVADASDTSNGGTAWSLTAVNRFPTVDIEKSIDGTVIGKVSEALFDTAVLPDDATTMPMRYVITNNGGMDLTNFVIEDPSLAGKTLTNASGATITVDDMGTIPADFCRTSGLTLTPGQTHTCAFDVDISAEPKDQTFNYSGRVTLTGVAANFGEVSDVDDFGAIRLSQAAGWMLPDTGMQTLVLVILLGLLAVGYGVWRYLRSRDEDEFDDDTLDEEGDSEE